MNLKNPILALAVILLMAGCDDKDIDKKLTDNLWIEVVKITGLKANTPKPEINFMDSDLYQEILLMNCESMSGDKKENCLTDRKELENSVPVKTGKPYAIRYGRHIDVERGYLFENCKKYTDENKKNQCVTDNFSRRGFLKILGRSFLPDHYLEIYYKNITDHLYKYSQYYKYYNLDFSYREQEAFFYSVILHEMLHEALYLLGIPANDQHQKMRDKYMDPLLNYISDYENADRKGYHHDMAFGSLDAGIKLDEVDKRIQNRKNSDPNKTKNDFSVLPCGLILYY